MAVQKPPQEHLARETSLLGVTRSPTSVARAPVISGGSHIDSELHETSTLLKKPGPSTQSKPSRRWGNGRSRAQWGSSRDVYSLSQCDSEKKNLLQPKQMWRSTSFLEEQENLSSVTTISMKSVWSNEEGAHQMF